MSDPTNLVYNGDFSKGTDSWSGTNLAVSNGVLTVTGNLSQSIFIPYSTSRRYKLTYDLKVDQDDGSHAFYIALHPYDSSKVFIDMYRVNKPVANTDTTLAADLKSGDMTATLTDGTNWPTSRTYQGLGICDLLAYGYNRCSKRFPYASKSGNIITLKNAYSGTTIPSGTKCSNFEDGGTYYYPHYLPYASLPSNWTTYSVEFNGSSIRYSGKYFYFRTLGYSHTYSMRNIRLECISDYQECPKKDPINSVSFQKTGIVTATNFVEYGMPIRYIRDTTAGSTANTNNHWNEIQVINNVGENIAWGKNVTVGGADWANSYITDGIINSNYNLNNTGVPTASNLVLDLGFVECITKIKIWHYYPDGRTYYNNVTEVSADGTNWFTVYQGQKPETSAGNEIILCPAYMSIYENGDINCNEFIEF